MCTFLSIQYAQYATDATLQTPSDRDFGGNVGKMPKINSRIFLPLPILYLFIYLIVNVVTRAFIRIPIYSFLKSFFFLYFRNRHLPYFLRLLARLCYIAVLNSTISTMVVTEGAVFGTNRYWTRVLFLL